MKLSIITINRNNSDGLLKTIESVVSQTFNDFEYIVIDGASIDESVGVIKRYEDKITYWVSEPDKGIYSAMNKGIVKATGTYCLFLNSGDWLVDKNVFRDFIAMNFNEEIVSGDTFLWRGVIVELRKAVSALNLTYDFLHNNVIIHQSTFIKRTLFSKFGLYNENNRIVSDWEFYLKTLILNNCSYTNFERNISYFDLNGISAQEEWKSVHKNEREQVINSLLPRVHKMYENLTEETIKLKIDIAEYQHLKNGSFGFVIRWLLKMKTVKKNAK